ncbi:MAG: dienelactone hydrolase family protein [Pseudomonadota bacterium]
MHFQQITMTSGARCTIARAAADPGADANPQPLVVSLHYGGPVSPWYGRGLLEGVVAPALAELGAVFVAPDCAQEQWASPDGRSAVLEAIDHAKANHAVDDRRVLLTGYSKGGIGTWALVSAIPDTFTAAIVMAGRPPGDLDAGAWRVPTLAIQAADDELMPLAATEVWIDELRAAGASAQLQVLDGVTHFETHRFGAPLRLAVPWIKRVWTA